MKRFRYIPLIAFILSSLIFFQAFFFQAKLPIPADTLIGLYHPFRDLYAGNFPLGIPFKNALITDPVRQQYPWRFLSIEQFSSFSLPAWNPYNAAGTPLAANFQAAAFYPLNIIFLLLPFSTAWSWLVFLQIILAGIFMYIYLRHLRLSESAGFIGAVSFAFSGFSISWLEWNTVGHVMVWLPFILLAVDKISALFIPAQKNCEYIKDKKFLLWNLVLLFSLILAFCAGHLQTFFYLLLLLIAYIIARGIQTGKVITFIFYFSIFFILFFLFTSIQWWPTLQMIIYSARQTDQINWHIEGWFIPWQHLVQFIAPDFFGNPSTLNYWGTWNYGELVGYVGLLPLLMAFYAMFFRHDRKTLFFGTIFFLSLIFSLPTFLAKLPFLLQIPFFSSSQPTRLLSLTDFSLAILAAIGTDYFLRVREKIIPPVVFLGVILGVLWGIVIFGKDVFFVSNESMAIAQRNLIFPSMIYLCMLIFIGIIVYVKKRKYTFVLVVLLLALTSLDLLRFAWKFTPFTSQEYLFPITETINFLQKNIGNSRLMTTDSRILPPNFSLMYKLQSVDVYDPLYLERYAQLIAASERGNPNIDPPFGFNRIITPHRYNSKIIDLLGVKYILSLSDIESNKLKKVFQEGETRVYENTAALPRAFFVKEISLAKTKKEAIVFLLSEKVNLKETAVVESPSESFPFALSALKIGRAEIIDYQANRVKIETTNSADGFLVLTDSYYPTWRARVVNNKEKEMPLKIYLTDFNFRGVFVPKGRHVVEFYNTLL